MLNIRGNLSIRKINRLDDHIIFEKCNDRYPFHGYYWLNAKINLDLCLVYSDNCAHKICKYLYIKSKSKHVKRYGKKTNK